MNLLPPGPSDKEFYSDSYTDDIGYTYRRKGNPYYKEGKDTYSVTYVCKKSICELALTYDSQSNTMSKSTKIHKCKLEDHQTKEFKTTISKVNISEIEKKVKENPMMPVPALYEELNKLGSGFNYSIKQVKNISNQTEILS